MSTQHCRRLSAPRLCRLRGVSLIEISVTLFLVSMVALAAWAMLSTSRANAALMNAQVEIAERARFSRALFEQLISQSGYLDQDLAASQSGLGPSADYRPVLGADNQSVASGASQPSASAPHGSDVITLRYIPALYLPGANARTSDGSMSHCDGVRLRDRTPQMAEKGAGSRLFITTKDGGSLTCQTTGTITGSGAGATGGADFGNTQEALLSGVEAMQILYGINDGADPNVIDTATATFRYLSASEVSDWKKVRSLRIGLVLRSDTPVPAASALAPTALCPLGKGNCTGLNTPSFTPPTDGYLRRTITFTVRLRNNMYLSAPPTAG